MNKASLAIIDGLHPANRLTALNALTECECELKGRAEVVLVYGTRTFKLQSDLYNLGRTVVNPDGRTAKKPMGNIVTKAKAGQSIHNYGLAIDFCLLIDGKLYKWDTIGDYDGDGIADWMEVVRIFKKHGWEWGGDWSTFPDQPHFQLDYGYSWQQLQAKYNVGDFIPGTTFVNLIRIAVPDPTRYRVTASVNFRTDGSTSASIMMVIIKGEYVTEISRQGSWSKIEYNGRQGYVSNQYLTK